VIRKRNIAGLISVFVVVTVRSHIHMDMVDAFTEGKTKILRSVLDP